MARLPRVFQKVFGSNASNNGQFGSARAGTFLTSSDIAVIQSLPAYVNGWNDATVTSEKLPTLEETQGLEFVTTQQLAYLFQEGIPEWNSLTPYYDTSIVKRVGTMQLYKSITNNNINHAVTDPSNWVLLCDLSDVVSKSYVDAIIAGLSPKGSSRVGTTAALTATYANGSSGVGATLTNSGALAAISIDGVALSLNDRVLVKDQAAPAQNGLYKVTTVGSGAAAWVLTRTTDYDTTAEIFEGTYSIVEEGSVNAGTLWIMTTNGTITVGTTSIAFTNLTFANGVTLNGTQTLQNKTISTGSSIASSVTGVTQSAADNSTKLATTAYADAAAAAAVAAQPKVLAAVTFNGVAGASILKSFNIASVTRNSTGNYSIAFTNATPDANYYVATSFSYQGTSGTNHVAVDPATAPTTGGIRIQAACVNIGGAAATDNARITITIYG